MGGGYLDFSSAHLSWPAPAHASPLLPEQGSQLRETWEVPLSASCGSCAVAVAPEPLANGFYPPSGLPESLWQIPEATWPGQE